MGRPRTPSNVLQMKGSFAKNPDRGRERENELEAIGDVGEPPEGMLLDEIGCWEEMKGMLPEGVLGKSDRMALELGSKLVAGIRRNGIENTPPAILARFHAVLGSLGMTPSDRSKVKMPPKRKTNSFQALDEAG